VSGGQVIVERDDVRVMFRRTADEQKAITRAWSEVEAAVGSLRGRGFYGTFDPAINEYCVCVQWREGDDPEALGLEQGTLPGGRYARERLEGAPPAVYGLILPTFERLAKRPDRDPSRLGIEFYRRRDLIDLLLPVV
jgi:hypothetical protein